MYFFFFILFMITTTHQCINRYRPMLSLNVVQTELGYSNLEDCLQFLKEKGAVLSEDSSKLDCKASSVVF